MPFVYRNRIILLTGASRGIGARIAEALAARGAHLILTARSEAALAQVAEACRAHGATVEVVAADLSDPTDRARIVAAVEANGPLAAVIHNAGLEIPVAVVDQSEADILAQLHTNLTAPILLTRALLPAMIARGRGAIVMVSSLSGKSATPYNAIYAATKHGLNGFTASLRLELADTGVTAGVVCPGFVAETGMWADSGVAAPTFLKEVPPGAVVAGVLRALDGAPEVLISAAPIRSLLALGQLFPRLDGTVMRATGILAALRERAAVTAARRG